MGYLLTMSQNYSSERFRNLVNDFAGLLTNVSLFSIRQKYEQSLPSTWMEIVETMPQLFELETCVDGRQILYATVIDNELSPSILLDNDFTKMPKLILPWTEKHWNVFVTNPVSTVEIWGRLVGPSYSDAMDTVITDIELNLMTNKQCATAINVGCIYLVIIDECPSRVRIDRNGPERSLCFFIDDGDREWMANGEIYVCDKSFLDLPPQAICFTLHGLEDFAENPNTKIHLEKNLANKTVIGDVLTQQTDFVSNDASIQMVFFDTTSNEDIRLNSQILEEICKSTPPPKLKEIGLTTNVTITHINTAADIYCHVEDAGIHYIEKLIHNLQAFKFDCDTYKILANDDDKSTVENNNNLHLVMDSKLKKWFRATIAYVGKSEYSMFYVDYGMVRSVETSKIFKLEGLSAALNTYPYQAVKMRLNGVKVITPSFVSSLKGLLAPSTKAIVSSKCFLLFLCIYFIRYLFCIR